MRIRVIWSGKTKKEYYRAAIQDYVSRLNRIVPVEIIETREESVRDRDRQRRVAVESKSIERQRRASMTVVLDSSGKQMTSEEFAKWLERQTDVDFILGGPEGIEISGSKLALSFGKITLPHELARVVLLEQIYRALTILKRIPYHK